MRRHGGSLVTEIDSGYITTKSLDMSTRTGEKIRSISVLGEQTFSRDRSIV